MPESPERLQGSDTVTFRMSWEVLPVPNGVAVELEDGRKVTGPAIIAGPPEIQQVDR